MTATVPTVTSVGRSKVRIEASEPKYTLSLWDAQGFASNIVLELERIQHGYNMPHETTRKRSIRISQRRTITVSGSRTDPEIRLEHARVLTLTLDQAHELVTVLISAIEDTEDHLEALGIDPYGPL